MEIEGRVEQTIIKGGRHEVEQHQLHQKDENQVVNQNQVNQSHHEKQQKFIQQINKVNNSVQNEERAAEEAQVMRLAQFGFSRDNHDVKFELRKHSLKITIITDRDQNKNDNNEEGISSLFQNGKEKHQKSQLKLKYTFIINNQYLPKEIKREFHTFETFYDFIYDNFTDVDCVGPDRCQLKLKLKNNEKQQQREMVVNLREYYQARSKNYKVDINVSNMEDRLLQFDNRQIEFIEQAYEYYSNGAIQNLSHKHANEEFLAKLKPLVEDNDEDQFSELYIKKIQEDFNEVQELMKIQCQEKSIEEFDQMFGNLKKIIYSNPAASYPPVNQTYAYQPVQPFQTNNYEDKVSVAASKTSSVFPPGYVPPHLAKSTAPDGLSTDQHLRFQANQTKKQKLKLAKQLLKMGFSTSEVIQKLQAQEKSMKTGNIEPSVIMTQNKPMNQGKYLGGHHSAQMQNQAAQNSNQRAVREMLISLLRQKRYKKLDEIQKHMQNEGLKTSVLALKKIIDEIRAKNAQRKSQSQKGME